MISLLISHEQRVMNISRFKRNISAELKAVSEGERLVILNGDKPMAEVIPYEDKNALLIREPKSSLEFPKVNIVIDGDPLIYLMEDRENR